MTPPSNGPDAATEPLESGDELPVDLLTSPQRVWRWLCGPLPDTESRYELSRWLLLRGLAVVWLTALISLWVQVHGLVGENGILPASQLLASVRDQMGWERHLWLPSVFWVWVSDGAMHLALGVGVVSASLLLFGRLQRGALLVLFVVYLSFSSVCAPFLGFQWDALLLEATFLALLLAPGGWRGKTRHPTSVAALFLMRWLVFRLVFMSGLVKFMAVTPYWRDLTAMTYHYWSQPLPNPVSLWADGLPLWVHQAEVVGTLAVELVVPFFFFGPRRLRRWAAVAIIMLQVSIGLTGNYGFFNLLTVVLTLCLLDDTSLRRLVRSRVRARLGSRPRGRPGVVRRLVIGMIFAVLMAASGSGFVRLFARDSSAAASLSEVFGYLQPYHVANSYGLFANMTVHRPEVILEASLDGQHWEEYEFVYKPGDLERVPAFAGPHMPRLDWQLWFAGLAGDCRRARWFLPFVAALLNGSEPVQGLLGDLPLQGQRPRLLRSRLFEYRFSESADAVWSRELVGEFCPTLTLNEAGQLVVAQPNEP